MGRGPLIFALAFILLPVLALAGAWALPGAALGLTFAMLVLLLTGFTVGLAFVDES